MNGDLVSSETMADTRIDWTKYPSIDTAYEFVLPSYTWALDGYKVIEERFQKLQTYAATLTSAAPVIVTLLANGSADYLHPFFLIGMFCFLVVIITAAWSQTYGELQIVSVPTIGRDDWLESPTSEYKNNIIKWAGTHQDFNLELLRGKAQLANVLVGLFVVEILLMVAWASSQT